MNSYRRITFHLCMSLSVLTMIYGHALIVSSGKWFIPNSEKYNIFTRWVSDFAAVWPQGLWIKGSIVLFCIALLIFKKARLVSCGAGLAGHSLWVWNSLLAFGMIAGLLLVALYDMSPPQFTVKDPSWLGRILGQDPVIVNKPPNEGDYLRRWHHRLGFQLFIFSYALTLLTATLEKFRIDPFSFRRNLLFLLVTILFMAWLMLFHQSLAGVPQRVLLITIFWWVWCEAIRLSGNPARTLASATSRDPVSSSATGTDLASDRVN